MTRHLLILPVLLAAFTPAAMGQQFVRNAAAIPAQTIWTDGVELVDVDADGDVDILFANGSAYGSTGTGGAQDQHLFLNDGSGTFTAAHGQLLHGGNFNAKMVIAEDFDGDGDPDLMYASGSAGHPPRLLLNDGSGNFAVSAGAVPTTPTLRSFSVVAGDIDDDGDLDVAITDGGTFGGQATQQRLWVNDGNGVFTDVTASQMPVDNFNCQDVQFLDFDGDFDLDLALSGKGQGGKRGRLYLNDGSGNFSIDSAMNLLGTGATYEIDYGDLDGDGDWDAAVQSINGQSEGWGRNDGAGAVMPELTFPSPNGNDDNEMALMDYDNDGDLDIFVSSLAGTGEKVYRNNGNSTFTNQNVIIQTISDSSLDFGFADLDGNGTYDMITGQGESGNFTNKIYFNNGPADTTAPTLQNIEAAGPISAPFLVTHAQIQDSLSDDGHISAGMTFTWTSNLGSGSDTAKHMGSGMFRASIPTVGTETFVDVIWTATDVMGNAVVAPTVSFGGGAWTSLGNGLAGAGGVPSLVGVGPLSASTANSVNLSNALASSTTNLVLGLAAINVSFKGGILGPSPDFLFLALPVSGAGSFDLPFVWPAGVPPGTKIFLQHWVSDAGGPVGFAASNVLQGEAQ
ncbi:MAG: hypothetical protein ACI9EF_000133 [Pseudohongiellaceae bacterium]|jgi:hypothetical protein